MGWRYMLFTLGAITFSLFILRFFIFPFYESPKFLLKKGHDQKAVDIVRKIAAFNKRPCDLTLESLRKMATDEPSHQASERTWRQRIYMEIVRFKLLFANRWVAAVTILVWMTWICNCFGIYLVFLSFSIVSVLTSDCRIYYRSLLFTNNTSAQEYSHSQDLARNIQGLLHRVLPGNYRGHARHFLG